MAAATAKPTAATAAAEPKRGRPAKEIGGDQLSLIQHSASMGLTLDQIALLCDVSPSTLDRWLKLPEVEQAYRKGRAIAFQQMATRLWDIAMSGDEHGAPTKQATTACIFWLKAQAGWSDRLVIQQDTADDSAKIQIYLPDNGR